MLVRKFLPTCTFKRRGEYATVENSRGRRAAFYSLCRYAIEFLIDRVAAARSNWGWVMIMFFVGRDQEWEHHRMFKYQHWHLEP